MGLDGFTMSNIGLHRDLTSAQMASQADELANMDKDVKIEDITSLSTKKGIKRRDGDSDGAGGFVGFGFKGKNPNEEEEDDDETSNFDEKVFENSNPKEFSVRINSKTEMVELFNNKSKKIVETISAGDLMALISKMDSASGVLVNKKV